MIVPARRADGTVYLCQWQGHRRFLKTPGGRGRKVCDLCNGPRPVRHLVVETMPKNRAYLYDDRVLVCQPCLLHYAGTTLLSTLVGPDA